MNKGVTLMEVIIGSVLTVIVSLFIIISINILSNLKEKSIDYVNDDNEMINLINLIEGLIEEYDGNIIIVGNDKLFFNNKAILKIFNNQIILTHIDGRVTKYEVDYYLNLSYINSNLVKLSYSNQICTKNRYFYIGGMIIENQN